MRDNRGENTRAAHLPRPPAVGQESLGVPVWRTAAFAFESAEEFADVLGDRKPGYSYSRVDNPTVDAFADAVAALEETSTDSQAVGQAFASGMAAITATLMAFTEAGAHVVAPTAVYGGTYSLLAHVLSRFGVSADFVDTTDPAAVAAAIKPNTRVIWTEALANPTMTVPDLPAFAGLAREADALLVVDATFATPVVCRPLEHGADLVVHSATKYIGGHSDVTGGVVVGRPELLAPIRQTRIETGASLAPDEASLLRRGLETLPVRVRRQCASALVFAAAIAKHPAVKRVDYPGLDGHQSHDLARRLFDAGPEGTRFGAVVTVTPYGGYEAGLAFANGLRLARVASSLGGTHTKVSHVASTSHRQFDESALAAADIDAGALRFSVGLEDAEDLIADATHALDALPPSQHKHVSDPTPEQPRGPDLAAYRTVTGEGPRGAETREAAPGWPEAAGVHEEKQYRPAGAPDEWRDESPPGPPSSPEPGSNSAMREGSADIGPDRMTGDGGDLPESSGTPGDGYASHVPPYGQLTEAFPEEASPETGDSVAPAGGPLHPRDDGFPFEDGVPASGPEPPSVSPAAAPPASRDVPPAAEPPAAPNGTNPWPSRSDNPDADKSEWWTS